MRACFLKYKDLMIRSFGTGVAKIIKGPTVENLMKEKNKEFCELVIEFGTQTAEFVKEILYKEKENHPNTLKILEENQLDNLAQVFTERRYTKKDNEFFADVLKKTLQKQDFLAKE